MKRNSIILEERRPEPTIDMKYYDYYKKRHAGIGCCQETEKCFNCENLAIWLSRVLSRIRDCKEIPRD